jgi:hypothetical protein
MTLRDEVEHASARPALEERIPVRSDDTLRSAVDERLRTERLRLERECEALRAKITRLRGSVIRSRR